MRPDPPTLKEASLAREQNQLADVDLSKLDSDISSGREAAPKG
jgi:hypothetical protein